MGWGCPQRERGELPERQRGASRVIPTVERRTLKCSRVLRASASPAGPVAPVTSAGITRER